jgi:lipopolysaccharide/colanic/teichoic acid biosynthesis glycosyltransferase
MSPAFVNPASVSGTRLPRIPADLGRRGRFDGVQRLFDLVIGSLLLLAAVPVILVAMLAVKLTSRGPALYRQARLGRFGQPFTIYKVRSMTHDCERQSGAQWCQKNDPRVTRVGGLLRKLHIDELPQLWNILKGEMSLVGPRPERPEIVAGLERAIPRYRERLGVRPGLTGLAQVQLPPDTDLDSVRRKLRYDLHYIATGSFWMDARLLVATAIHVCGLPFGLSRRGLGLPGMPEVEPDLATRGPFAPPASEVDTAEHPICPTLKEVSVDAARA